MKKKIYSADELIKKQPKELDFIQIKDDGSTMVKEDGEFDNSYKNVYKYEMSYDKKFARITFFDMLGEVIRNFTALYSNKYYEDEKLVITKVDDNKYIISVEEGKEKE